MMKRKITPKLSSSSSSSAASRSISTTSSPPKASSTRVRSQSVASRRPMPLTSGHSTSGGGPRGSRASAKTLEDTTVTDDDDLYRVRSFTTRMGVVVNRGDSFKRRGPRQDKDDAIPVCLPQPGVFRTPPPAPSSHQASSELATPDEVPLGTGHIVSQFSVGNTDFEANNDDPSLALTRRESPDLSGAVSPGRSLGRKGRFAGTVSTGGDASGDEGNEATPVYKVLVLGSQGVGKTTLTRQLLSSEYYCSDCNNADDRDDETVTVVLDEVESIIQFIDSPGFDSVKSGSSSTHAPNTPEGRFETRLGSRDFGKTTSTGDGFLVVYSVTDRSSLTFAQNCLQELRPAKRHNAVILVANKHDLVRKRMVPETEGIKLATKRHCKFIEVSALLDHRLDELLVGIVRQIRLRQTSAGEDLLPDDLKSSGSRLSDTIGAFFQKVFKKDRTPGGKCEDLMVP